MGESSESKQWWEAEFEWTLSATLQETFKSGHKLLNKPLNSLTPQKPSKDVALAQPDPMETVADAATVQAVSTDTRKTTGNRIPKPVPPPPKPDCLMRKEQPAEFTTRAVNMPQQLSSPVPTKDKVAQAVEEQKLTLDQLLDPEFCGYTS